MDRPNAGVVDGGSTVANRTADTPGSDAGTRAGGKDISDDGGNASTLTPIGTPKQTPFPWPCIVLFDPSLPSVDSTSGRVRMLVDALHA